MKKIFSCIVLMLILVTICGISVSANETTYRMGNNVYMTYNDQTRDVIIEGTGEMYDYDTDGYDVIGHINPFKQIDKNKINDIIISDGITSIGNYSLCGIQATSVQIPNSVRIIGDSSFGSITIKSDKLIIPNGVTYIGKEAFMGVFRFTPLGHQYNGLDIMLPDSVTYVGERAFAMGGIKSMKFSNAIKSLPISILEGNPHLKSVILPDKLVTIEDGAFFACPKLETIALPDSLKSIGQNAFNGCILLTDINIPGSMQTIGANAFAGCRRLFNVTMQEGVRNIDDNAFNGCIRLQTMTLPASIQSIGDYAFNQCTMLRSVMIRNGNANLGRQVFNGCPVTLSASKGSRVQAYAKSNGIGFKDNGSYAVPFVTQEYISGSFRYKVLTSGSNGGTVQVIAPINNKKTKLTISATVKLNTYNFTVTSIAKNAFKSNKKLKSVNIGKYVTSIGDRAFYNCSALTSVKFGNRVNEIGKAAFRGCSNLKKVKLPTKVTSIKDEMFYGCKKLTNVTLGNNTTTVGNSAFSGCSSLKSITIPSRVRTLGSKAFYNCKNLKKITVKGTTLRKVGSSALKKINGQVVIKVPKSKVRKYTSLFKGKGQSKTVKVSK